MKLTRRKLATAVLNSAAFSAFAQTSPSTPDEDLKAARDRIKANTELLARQIVPIDVEPALQFKA